MTRDYKHPFRCGPGPCTWYCEPSEELAPCYLHEWWYVKAIDDPPYVEADLDAWVVDAGSWSWTYPDANVAVTTPFAAHLAAFQSNPYQSVYFTFAPSSTPIDVTIYIHWQDANNYRAVRYYLPGGFNNCLELTLLENTGGGEVVLDSNVAFYASYDLRLEYDQTGTLTAWTGETYQGGIGNLLVASANCSVSASVPAFGGSTTMAVKIDTPMELPYADLRYGLLEAPSTDDCPPRADPCGIGSTTFDSQLRCNASVIAGTVTHTTVYTRLQPGAKIRLDTKQANANSFWAASAYYNSVDFGSHVWVGDMRLVIAADDQLDGVWGSIKRDSGGNAYYAVGQGDTELNGGFAVSSFASDRLWVCATSGWVSAGAIYTDYSFSLPWASARIDVPPGQYCGLWVPDTETVAAQTSGLMTAERSSYGDGQPCFSCQDIARSVGAMAAPCPPVEYRRGKPVLPKGKRKG